MAIDLSDLGPAATSAPAQTPQSAGVDLSDLGPQQDAPATPAKPSLGDWITKIGPAMYGAAFGHGGMLETPWSKASNAFPDMAGAASEWLGKHGANPKLAAAATLPVSMFPNLVSAYGALPQGAQSALSEAPGKILGRLGDEAGSVSLGGGGEPEIPQPPTPVMGSSEPNYLERSGGAGLNATAGIRGTTIQKLAKAGQNPGAVGIDLAKQLNSEGAIGSSPISTWDNVNKLKESAGSDVGSAMHAIRDQAAKLGSDGDPLMVDAKTALKPVYEGWAYRAGGMTSAMQSKAKHFEEIYNGLTDIAKNQGGQLHLDNIKQAMDEIGPMTHKGAPEVQEAMQELYGALADTNDHMVQTIAKGANNPTLASNLLNANERYSRYMRIMPDISRASAMESVGQKTLMDMLGEVKNSIVSKAALSAGQTGPQQIGLLGKLGSQVSRPQGLILPGQEQP